jgi:transposase
MIVIGLDVHKHSVTAVAVDEAPQGEGDRGRQRRAARLGRRAYRRAVVGGRGLPPADAPARAAAALLAGGEELVRVPPKLTVPERRAGRTRGKSDPIDALAIVRAALREPDLSRPRPDQRVYRAIKLLVDHRDDLVDQRRRTQQPRRLPWENRPLDAVLLAHHVEHCVLTLVGDPAAGVRRKQRTTAAEPRLKQIRGRR